MKIKREEEMEREAYAYWLNNVEGVGNRTRLKLTEYAESPKAVFHMTEKELTGLVGAKKAGLLARSREKKAVLEEYSLFSKGNIRYLSKWHPEYPERLAQIEDAPFGIYVWGRLPDKRKKAVALIGARQCSEYGRYLAGKCGMELARAGVEVISGLARGIDGIGQAAAVEAGGNTYAVLGSGVSICYPEENRRLYERIKETGGLLSEFSPMTPPKAPLFPMRNRIISGLSDAVLIVEAREKSGTLITADMALEQGREVFAVPGRITDGLSEGCNRLIKQGANVFTSVDEMLEELGMDNIRKNDIIGMNEKDAVWNALDFYPKSIETIQNEIKMDYRTTVCRLTELCLRGGAKQVSAGCYVKICRFK